MNSYFNTSHVSINPIMAKNFGNAGSNFNTSHVSINPILSKPVTEGRLNFNTSHVSINQNKGHEALLNILFQYISCFY